MTSKGSSKATLGVPANITPKTARNAARTNGRPKFSPRTAHLRRVDRGDVLNDHRANATDPHHRRRLGRVGSRLADRKPWRARRAARDAADAVDGRAQDGIASGAR